MGLFWKRKGGDQFISLRLNEPPVATADKSSEELPGREAETDSSASVSDAQSRLSKSTGSASAPVLEPVPTGAGPTPVPLEPPTTGTQTSDARSPVQPIPPRE